MRGNLGFGVEMAFRNCRVERPEVKTAGLKETGTVKGHRAQSRISSELLTLGKMGDGVLDAHLKF